MYLVRILYISSFFIPRFHKVITTESKILYKIRMSAGAILCNIPNSPGTKKVEDRHFCGIREIKVSLTVDSFHNFVMFRFTFSFPMGKTTMKRTDEESSSRRLRLKEVLPKGLYKLLKRKKKSRKIDAWLNEQVAEIHDSPKDDGIMTMVFYDGTTESETSVGGSDISQGDIFEVVVMDDSTSIPENLQEMTTGRRKVSFQRCAVQCTLLTTKLGVKVVLFTTRTSIGMFRIFSREALIPGIMTTLSYSKEPAQSMFAFVGQNVAIASISVVEAWPHLKDPVESSFTFVWRVAYCICLTHVIVSFDLISLLSKILFAFLFPSQAKVMDQIDNEDSELVACETKGDEPIGKLLRDDQSELDGSMTKADPAGELLNGWSVDDLSESDEDEPTESTDSTDSTEPIEPTEPTELTEPTEPTTEIVDSPPQKARFQEALKQQKVVNKWDKFALMEDEGLQVAPRYSTKLADVCFVQEETKDETEPTEPTTEIVDSPPQKRLTSFQEALNQQLVSLP